MVVGVVTCFRVACELCCGLRGTKEGSFRRERGGNNRGDGSQRSIISQSLSSFSSAFRKNWLSSREVDVVVGGCACCC